MKRVIAVLAILSLLASCQGEKNSQDLTATEALKVIVTTGVATDIDPASAKLNGTCSISNAKDANGTACFYYSKTNGSAETIKAEGLKAEAGTISNSGSAFFAGLKELDSSSEYFFVAGISIDGQEFCGNVSSFTTQSKSRELSVTGSASDITEFTAKITGYANITPELGEVTIGILYSTDENPTLENGVELASQELDDNNMFIVTATDLSFNTVYYYKSFVQYGGLYRFGDVKSFKTKDIENAIVTGEADGLEYFRATLHGLYNKQFVDNRNNKPAVYIVYSDTAEDIDSMNNFEIPVANEDGTLTCTLQLLKAKTKYYYAAYAKINGKYVYGEVKSFTTNDYYGAGTRENPYTVADAMSIGTALSLRARTPDMYYVKGKVSSIESQFTLLNGNATFRITDESGYTFYAYRVNYLNNQYWTTGDTRVKIDQSIILHCNIYSYPTGNGSLIETYDGYIYYLDQTPVSAITLDKESILFHSIGNKEIITASVLPEDADNLSVSWFSSNTSVATVSDGEITSRGWGTTTISVAAKDGSGVTAKCEVEVRQFTFGAIDLGLSVRWANANIGAAYEEDYGGYFAWGEIKEKETYDWSTYKWCKYDSNNPHSPEFSKYNSQDKKRDLDPEDDVARVRLGNGWRIPTMADINELIDNTTWKWITKDGVDGALVTSNINGNSIFLPATGGGFYSSIYGGYGILYVGTCVVLRSSQIPSSGSKCAEGVAMSKSSADSGKPSNMSSSYRCCGNIIRPVKEAD